MVARNKLVLQGTMGAAGQEQWSIGLHYRDPGGGALLDPAGLNLWAQTAYGNLSAAVTSNLANIMGPNTRIVRIATYGYGPTGPAVAQGSYAGTAVVGTGASQRLAPQDALVCTLLTGLAGRSYRGRIYWPAGGMLVGTDLKASVPAGTASSFAQLIAQLGEAEEGVAFLEPVVYSATKNVLTEVSGVSVGDIIDSQRSRRNNLVETRQVADVP